MANTSLRKRLADELTTPRAERPIGSGWVSGTAALVLGLAGLFTVVCLHYPTLFTVPQLRVIGGFEWFRPALHFGLIFAYALAMGVLQFGVVAHGNSIQRHQSYTFSGWGARAAFELR